MLKNLIVLMMSLSFSVAQAAPVGAVVIDANKCINYLSDLECESESSMSARRGLGGEADASCAFNVDIAERETGAVTSHNFTKSTGTVYHTNFLSGMICVITIGFGCLPFQLSAKIDAAGQASDAIEPLYDYYSQFVETHACDEKEFN